MIHFGLRPEYQVEFKFDISKRRDCTVVTFWMWYLIIDKNRMRHENNNRVRK